MKQLALDVKLADFAVFDSFHPGGNAVVVAALRALALEPGHGVQWVWGRKGTGRSHLLQAVLNDASRADRRCAWLPLADPGSNPALLEGLGALDLLCVDDIDAVAGDPDWERPLFRLFEALRESRGALIVSAATPPREAGFALSDLASRLGSGPVWKLRRLDDEELQRALQKRARWRGLELSDEAAVYLLNRTTREPRHLFALLDDLDTAALAEQRRLTVPFLREALMRR